MTPHWLSQVLPLVSHVSLTARAVVAAVVLAGVLGVVWLLAHHLERAGAAEERAAQLTAELRAQGVAHEETQAAWAREREAHAGTRAQLEAALDEVRTLGAAPVEEGECGPASPIVWPSQ